MLVTTEADEEDRDFLMPCGAGEDEEDGLVVEHLQQRLDNFEAFVDVVFTTIRLSSMSSTFASRLLDEWPPGSRRLGSSNGALLRLLRWKMLSGLRTKRMQANHSQIPFLTFI